MQSLKDTKKMKLKISNSHVFPEIEYRLPSRGEFRELQ